MHMTLPPLLLLVLGVAVVLSGILWLRLSAFLSLIAAALIVALLSGGPPAEAVEVVGRSFGEAAGKIGIVIAFAAVIGRAMTSSGAARRIVAALTYALGPRRSQWALMASGYVLSVPVFFDTVFYLLLPLAKAQGRSAGGRYLYALLAICSGAAITHTLVPPTPGPLAMAAALDVPIGMMMAVGALVALPATVVAMALSRWLDARIDVRDLTEGFEQEEPPGSGEGAATPPPADAGSPSLAISLAPVVLPITLISASTFWGLSVGSTAPAWVKVLGHPVVALGLAMALSLGVARLKASTERQRLVEEALADAGAIILITAAGAAFGASLKGAGVGEAVQSLFGATGGGFGLLFVGFALAALLKASQGSSTAAMIVGSSMLAAVAGGVDGVFHRVYLCTAVGGGALVGSWMNDSGFWLFSTMGGLGERRTLKTWTPLLACLGVSTLLTTLLLAWLLPLV